MTVEKTYKIEIQGKKFALAESEAKDLYNALNDAFKQVDTAVSQPSQDSQLPSGS